MRFIARIETYVFIFPPPGYEATTETITNGYGANYGLVKR